MKKIISAAMIIASLSLAGCASGPNGYNNGYNNNGYNSSQVNIKQGRVIGIQNTTVSVNDPNMAGAAIGGVAGGVVGNQFGKGNGRKAMTILGALGGAAVGSQVNSQKLVPGYAVTVRGNDGQVFTFNSQNYLSVGQIINYSNSNNQITLH